MPEDRLPTEPLCSDPFVARLLADGWLRSIEAQAELGSTNDRALELAHDGGHALPVLVHADRQTAGRGCGAAAWWSSEGSLTFSLLLDAAAIPAPESRHSALPLAMAAAVADAVGPLLPAGCDPPWVKWPNDVYLGDRKLAGVLTEAPALAVGRRLVVGVGVNLNNRSAYAPAEARRRLTSVADSLGRELSTDERRAVLAAVLSGFAERLAGLAEGFAAPVGPWLGKRVAVDTPAGRVRGEYEGIDDAGALLLQVDGRRQRIVSGENLRPDP